ncbi:hypothetical protein ACM66B_007092 [Microbotryomycetes sp. NB124-2]
MNRNAPLTTLNNEFTVAIADYCPTPPTLSLAVPSRHDQSGSTISKGSMQHVIWTKFDDECLFKVAVRVERIKREEVERQERELSDEEEEQEEKETTSSVMTKQDETKLGDEPKVTQGTRRDSFGRFIAKSTPLPRSLAQTKSTLNRKRRGGGRRRDPFALTIQDWEWIVEDIKRRGAHQRTPIAAKARYRSLVKDGFATGLTSDDGTSLLVKKKVKFSLLSSEEEVDEVETEVKSAVDASQKLTDDDCKVWTISQDKELVRLKLESPPRRRRVSTLTRSTSRTMSLSELVKQFETSPFAPPDEDDDNDSSSGTIRQQDDLLTWSEISSRLSPTSLSFSPQVRHQLCNDKRDSLLELEPVKTVEECQIRWTALTSTPPSSFSSSTLSPCSSGSGGSIESRIVSRSMTSFNKLKAGGQVRSRELNKSDKKWKVRPSVRRSVKAVKEAFRRTNEPSWYGEANEAMEENDKRRDQGLSRHDLPGHQVEQDLGRLPAFPPLPRYLATQTFFVAPFFC